MVFENCKNSCFCNMKVEVIAYKKTAPSDGFAFLIIIYGVHKPLRIIPEMLTEQIDAALMLGVFFDSYPQRNIVALLQFQLFDILRAYGRFVKEHAFLRDF